MFKKNENSNFFNLNICFRLLFYICCKVNHHMFRLKAKILNSCKLEILHVCIWVHVVITSLAFWTNSHCLVYVHNAMQSAYFVATHVCWLSIKVILFKKYNTFKCFITATCLVSIRLTNFVISRKHTMCRVSTHQRF